VVAVRRSVCAFSVDRRLERREAEVAGRRSESISSFQFEFAAIESHQLAKIRDVQLHHWAASFFPNLH
jgi:hypothetical protein